MRDGGKRSGHRDASCPLADCQVAHPEKIEDAQGKVYRMAGDDLADINRGSGVSWVMLRLRLLKKLKASPASPGIIIGVTC